MKNLLQLTHRDALGYWLNEAGLIGAGVEIGSAFGQFSQRILSVWQGRSLTMVDPWEKQHPNEYLEKHDHVDFEDWYARCQKIAEDDKRVQLVRKVSKDAAPDVRNLSLDFVYIDGNHDYGHVMQDLDLWYPKVKVGGLVGGHDFYTSHEGGACCDVDRAVIRWMQEHHTVFSVTPCTSWWCIKY